MFERFRQAARRFSDPQVALLCRELAEAPPLPPGSEIHEVQTRFGSGDFDGSFSLLQSFLERYRIHPRQPWSPDREAFRVFRKAKRITQVELAVALGVSQSAVSQFEARNGYLKFANLVIAATFLDASPREFIISISASPSQSNVLRIDRSSAS